jgi:methylthioribose-1-phosphate isomerase
VSEIPIELRDAREVRYISGLLQSKKPEIGTDDTKSVSAEAEGEVVEVLLCPASSNAANYAFDVTPARLVTGLVTERGVCKANEEAILALFPEKESSASRKKRRV